MSGWVTQRQAAELLGVHPSAVPKMVRRGDLAPRDGRPSLSRKQVLELRDARAAVAAEAERRRATPTTSSGPKPPDDEHEWLMAAAAAAMLGCSVGAIRARAVRGRVPSEVAGGHRWFRFDHLELVVRAQAAKTRQPTSR